MLGIIDCSILRYAVDTTMKRYPYFCVKLQMDENNFVFDENYSSVVISNSLGGVDLNSEKSNYHTLLYYYCSKCYNVKLSKDGVRIVGDKIPAEEWDG